MIRQGEVKRAEQGGGFRAERGDRRDSKLSWLLVETGTSMGSKVAEN